MNAVVVTLTNGDRWHGWLAGSRGATGAAQEQGASPLRVSMIAQGQRTAGAPDWSDVGPIEIELARREVASITPATEPLRGRPELRFGRLGPLQWFTPARGPELLGPERPLT